MIVTCENCTSRFVVDPKVLQPRGRRVRCARCKTIWFQAPPETGGLSGDADMRESSERKQVFQRAPQAQDAAAQQVFGNAGDAPAQPAEDEAPARQDTAADAADQQDTAADAADQDDDRLDNTASDAIDDDIDALYGDDPTGAASSSDDDMASLPWDKQRGKGRKPQVPALYKERSPIYQIAGWAALVALILAATGSVIFARDTIAEKLPASKKLYAAVGLSIEQKVITQNVAAYLNIETPPPPPAYWRGDQLIQEIKGTIINIADAPVRVPTLEGILRDRDNNELYRWLFSAEAAILYPGQRASFATEIVDLPQEAAEMELVFAEGRDPAPLVGSQAPDEKAVENSR